MERKERKKVDKLVTALQQLGSSSLPAQLVLVFLGAAPSLQGGDVGEASA